MGYFIVTITSMPITHFITHKIQKAPKQPGAALELSDEQLAGSEYAQSVMNQLKGIFIQRASKRYGRFDPEQSTFRALLQNWLGQQQSFESFTQTISKYYAEKMDLSDLEIEGYLAFVAEDLADGQRFYAFHLRERSNLAFNEKMEIVYTQLIDFSNTGFAMCIDTTAFSAQTNEEYFTFSFGRGDKPLQNLFMEFCGFTDTINTEQETKEFLEIVDQYTQTLPEERAQETRSVILDYCVEQDKHGESVEFEVISSQLDDQAPKKFQEFVMEKRQERRLNQAISASGEVADNTQANSSVKSEFIPDRKSLKNYIRFSGKNKDVTLSFAATALGGDIQFDASSDSLVIKNLPSRLLKQLKKQ